MNKLILISLFCFLHLFSFAKGAKAFDPNRPDKHVHDTTIFNIKNKSSYSELNFKRIGLDSMAQFLFDNNPIFINNWDNERLFVYSTSDVNDLPDTINIKLLNAAEKFTLTYYNGVSSGYGYRWGSKHEGLDLPLRVGDSVMSAFDGVVRYARYSSSGYGNCVIVRHLNGLETLYGHLSQINVLENQFLKSGDLLGLGGSTGRSTGPHLHFETRLNGHSFNPKLIIDIDQKNLIADSISIPRKVLFSFTPKPEKTYTGKVYSRNIKSVKSSRSKYKTVSAYAKKKTTKKTNTSTLTARKKPAGKTVAKKATIQTKSSQSKKKTIPKKSSVVKATSKKPAKHSKR